MKAITWPKYTGERRHFPGVPSPRDGYGEGVVLPLSETGMSEDEAKAAIKGTPLVLVDLKEAKTTKGGD